MAQKKWTVHVISHSHWDREWYMALERHKMKLLDLIDDSLALFDADPAFRSFHLDGQTIALDDYLEICPEKREEIERRVREGRLRIGPFYILQDEFLTSGEANVRNIQTGLREAAAYGGATKIGYFPDAFGNAGQMPQLLRQAGMEAVAFGRGVKPVGFNNALQQGGRYESSYSEMEWESPDGSRLLGILFANWYNNGMEIPVDEQAARAYWDERLAKAQAFASTSQLLFMNGCDHQPVQRDLSAALETARRLYPDIEFVHSNFEDYVAAVKRELTQKENTAGSGTILSTVHGELTSQETDGWYTLVNTTSSHAVLKRMNRQTEVSLERVAEPLCAMAALQGRANPQDRLRYAWKILMQNHPHDSICGCSVDEVNKEIETRFDRSNQVAQSLIEDAAGALADDVDTSAFASYGEGVVPFVVFATSGHARRRAVSAVLDVKRDYNKWLWDGRAAMEAWPLPQYRVVDSRGRTLEATVEDAGVAFGYDLPNDRFRQPYMARRVRVFFYADELPAMGYAAFALVPETAEDSGASAATDIAAAAGADSQTPDRASANHTAAHEKSSTTAPAAAPVTVCAAFGSHTMENGLLRVAVHADGTLTVFDKQTGRTYENLGYFEDTLDAGNEYIYFCPEGNPALLTKGQPAQIYLAESTPFAATYEIVHLLTVPVSADGSLRGEQQGLVEFMKRKCGRSGETTTLRLRIRVTLEKGSATLRFRTEFDNTARDHRLRVVFPTGIACDCHYADSVFEVVKRPNEHSPLWRNPSKCEHEQAFVGLNDDKGGLLAANIGLYEYEIVPVPTGTAPSGTLTDGNVPTTTNSVQSAANGTAEAAQAHGNSDAASAPAIALTLVRCVGEMGDWGYFPTERSQQLRTITADYALTFFAGDLVETNAFREAYDFQVPLTIAQTAVHSGPLAPYCEQFLWEGDRMMLSNLKIREDGTDRMARFVNCSDRDTVLRIKKTASCETAYFSNILEEELRPLPVGQDGWFELPVRRAEIVTVGLR